MKTLKVFGLSAIATLGLMAFIGVSTASATTICKTNVNPCPVAWDWPLGTSLHGNLKPTASRETSRLTSPNGNTVATCSGLTLIAGQDQISGIRIQFAVSVLNWIECTSTVDNISTGKLTIRWLKESEAEVSSDETKVTVVLSGITCTYTTGEGTKLGTIKGGSEPILKIETKIKKAAGSFACPTEPIWDAEAVITEPNPIFPTE